MSLPASTVAATSALIDTILQPFGLMAVQKRGHTRYVQVPPTTPAREAAATALKARAAQERGLRRGAEAMQLELAAQLVRAGR